MRAKYTNIRHGNEGHGKNNVYLTASKRRYADNNLYPYARFQYFFISFTHYCHLIN